MPSQSIIFSSAGTENQMGVMANTSFAALLTGLTESKGVLWQSSQGEVLSLDDLLALLQELIEDTLGLEGENKESQADIESHSSELETMLDNLTQELDAMLLALFTKSDMKSSISSTPFLSDNSSLLGTFFNSAIEMKDDAQLKSQVMKNFDFNSSLGYSPQQQEVLQTLKSLLLAAKEGQINLSKEDLGRINQLLQQIQHFLGNKAAVPRTQALINNSIGLFNRGVELHKVTPVVASSGEHEAKNMQSQSSLSEQPQAGETSTRIFKAGFHQFVLSNVHHSAEHKVTSEALVRSQHFQKDMNDLLIRQLQMVRLPNGVSEARIKLFPENLGSVDVKLVVNQGVLTALFTADTRVGKELLEGHLAGLRASLLTSGLQVERLEVSLASSQSNGESQDTLFRQGKDEQEEHQQMNQALSEDEGEEDFMTVFEEFSQVI